MSNVDLKILQNLNLAILKLKQNSSLYEIEFKFQNCTQQDVESFKHFLSSSDDYILLENIEYVQEIYNNPPHIKKFKLFETHRKKIYKDNTVYEVKTRDQRDTFIVINGRTIKISLSKEYPKTASDFAGLKLNSRLNKERSTYMPKKDEDNYYKIDITTTLALPADSSCDGRKYEIEIELTNVMKITNVKKIFGIVSKFAELNIEAIIIAPITNMSPVSTNSAIISRKVTSILNEGRRFGKGEEKIFNFNKPRRLRHEDCKKLVDDYCFTMKSNGQRVFLFIDDDDSVYEISLYRKSEWITRLFKSSAPHYYKNTTYLLDSEKITTYATNGNICNKYLIFDCMIYKGINVKNMFYIQRLKRAMNAIQSITLDNVFMKKVYFDWNCILALPSWIEIDKGGGNDGIIFYPTLSTYHSRDILKYKRNDTIDFKIECVNNGLNEGSRDICRTYVANKDMSLVLFTFPPYFDGTVDKENAKYDGKIIEMKWNHSLNIFEFFQDRSNDKSVPNYIDIATDNFNGIINRITIPAFHDYIKVSLENIRASGAQKYDIIENNELEHIHIPYLDISTNRSLLRRGMPVVHSILHSIIFSLFNSKNISEDDLYVERLIDFCRSNYEYIMIHDNVFKMHVKCYVYRFLKDILVDHNFSKYEHVDVYKQEIFSDKFASSFIELINYLDLNDSYITLNKLSEDVAKFFIHEKNDDMRIYTHVHQILSVMYSEMIDQVLKKYIAKIIEDSDILPVKVFEDIFCVSLIVINSENMKIIYKRKHRYDHIIFLLSFGRNYELLGYSHKNSAGEIIDSYYLDDQEDVDFINYIYTDEYKIDEFFMIGDTYARI